MRLLSNGFRCNMWVSSTVAWIPDAIYMRGNESIEAASLEGRDCYAGLDLSSTGDITALVLIFPPRDENEKYVLLPYFWIPEETIPRRVKANSVPYDIWEKPRLYHVYRGKRDSLRFY